MKLKSLYYIEHKGTPAEWELKEFQLHDIDLFVAKNATGKSRTLSVINSLSLLLSKNIKFSNCLFSATFEDNDDTIEYLIEFATQSIKQERLTKNEQVLISRNESGDASIWYEGLQKDVSTRLPLNDIAILRKDQIQHPYLTILTDWGLNSVQYQFGSGMGKETQTVFQNNPNGIIEEPDLKNGELVIHRFKVGVELFGKSFIESIKIDMEILGYFLDDIKLGNSDIPATNAKCIYVKEKDINNYIIQQQLSQGMFRALSLLINIAYIQFKELKGCILIDDIGEGLDFDRSSALIKMLVKKSKNSFTQLFMTTNDRYVMNEVSLDYWNVIVRDNQVCHIINKDNSEELFDEFRFTGLNNFDFLSMDFYQKDSVH